MTSSRHLHPTRRAVLAGLAVVPWASLAQDSGTIRIGQSTALSGPLSDLGQAMQLGAQACFAALNARGGVAGRKIELVTLDDGYDAKRALANVEGFLADKHNFALFNCMGTPMIQAMLPKVIASGVPFFAPFTGALLARPKGVRSVFNIRASYPEEAEQLVQHLATIGIRHIGIAYQNNAFGKEVYDGARLAMEKHKLTGATVVTVENDSSDAVSAAAQLAEANPQAVLVALAGKPTLDFVKAMRAQRKGLPLYATSVMGSAATVKAMGADGVGVTISQVVPPPARTRLPIVSEFQRDWKALGAKLDPSHLALEGYINARVFAEAVRRTGRDLTRANFIDATWSLKHYELGGFEVSFTEPGRNASRLVDLVMVGRNGQLVS